MILPYKTENYINSYNLAKLMHGYFFMNLYTVHVQKEIFIFEKIYLISNFVAIFLVGSAKTSRFPMV